MKILLYSPELPFGNNYKSLQYHTIISCLATQHELYICLPFSDNEIILMDYETLEKNNIKLPKNYSECKFILYQKLTLPELNNIIVENDISLFFNLFEIFPKLLYHSKPNFSCKSLIWYYEQTSIDELIISQLSIYSHILVITPKMRELISSYLPNKIISNKLPIYNLSERQENFREKYKIPLASNIITWYLDTNNNLSLDAFYQIYRDSGDNTVFFLLSCNHLKEKQITYQVPKDFVVGNKLKLSLAIDNFIEIDTIVGTHKIGGKYKHNFVENKIKLFLKKKRIADRILYLNNYNYQEEIEIIKNSDKIIDLSNYTQSIFPSYLSCIYSIPFLTLQRKSGLSWINEINLIKTREISLDDRTINIFDEKPIKKFIETNNDNNEDSLLSITECNQLDDLEIFLERDSYKEYLENKKLTYDFNNIDKKISTAIQQLDIDNVYIYGNISNESLSYLTWSCPYLKNIFVFNTEEREKVNNEKIIFEKLENTTKDIQNSIKNIPQSFVILDKSSSYKDSIKSLDNKRVLHQLSVEDEKYSYWGIIHQDKEDLSKYNNLELNKAFIITVNNDKNKQYKVTNVDNFPELDIDIFYGVSSHELDKFDNWHQDMIANGRIAIKNNLRNVEKCARFFRHRILWEEIVDRSDIEVAYITEMECSLLPTNKLNIPNVDIIFTRGQFYMEAYILTKSGAKKLLQYTKQMVCELDMNILLICKEKPIYYYNMGLDENYKPYKLELSENEIIKKKEPKVVKTNGKTIFGWISNTFYDINHYLFGSMYESGRRYLASWVLYFAINFLKKN